MTSTKRKSGPGPLDRSLVHLLYRAGQCAGNAFQHDVITSKLTTRQYAVLVTVAHNEGLSQTQLVAMTGIDRATMADIIRRMVEKGLLQRARTKEDGRAYAVRLTKAGARVLKGVEPVAKRADNRILSALPAAQRNQLIESLTALIGALDIPGPASHEKRRM